MKLFTVPVATRDELLLAAAENLRSLVIAVYDVQQAVLVPLIDASNFS